jgi:putative GTP pyrophosphokinase
VASTSKAQIDLLGDRLRKGELSDDDLARLDDYRASFGEAYEEVVAAVRAATKLEPTGRPAKSTTSIVEKLRRETIRLSQMQDIAGCRLVVEDIVAQEQVVERLKSGFAKAAVVDRRRQPSYGYRAVHVIATARNRLIEIQIRTGLQHLWAQLSERLADAVDPAIKYGGGEPAWQVPSKAYSESIARLEDIELQASGAAPSAELDRIRGKLDHIKRGLRESLEESLERAAEIDLTAEEDDEDAVSD